MSEPEPLAEVIAALARACFEQAFADAQEEIDRRWITGNGTGEPRGIRDWEPREPTPMERALALLDPHLRACPQYDAGPPAIYPSNWKDAP